MLCLDKSHVYLKDVQIYFIELAICRVWIVSKMTEHIGKLLAPVFFDNLQDDELITLAKCLEKKKVITNGTFVCFFYILFGSSYLLTAFCNK